MKLTPFFLTIRAIAADFAQRIYLPTVLIAGGILVVLLGLLIWLVAVSAWWWFGLAPVILLSIAFTVLGSVGGILIYLLKPQQTKTQRKLVRSFVDSLQKTAETFQLPKVVVLFRLIKDLVLPSERGFVKELASNTSSLKNDLQAIIKSFDNA